MQITQDYYNLLGITPGADTQEINRAYRKLAFLYHPDRNHNDMEANEKMKEINEAYSTLVDTKKRQSYDLPLGYSAIAPKFKTGNKVTINYHSTSPYRDHTGVIDKEPVKDAFRFWYMVRFEMTGFSTIVRFAEEELSNVLE
jgi:curved DNA-binding protein CbpA